MRLIGVELSGSGLPFVSAKATHRYAGDSLCEVVVPAEKDAAPMVAWLEANDWFAIVRVATPEEIEDWERWQDG